MKKCIVCGISGVDLFHGTTEEQPLCVKCDTIEVSPEESEAIHLMLAREAGQPEPVLYQDDSIPLIEDSHEEELCALVDVQERMSKGMKLIKEAEQKLLQVRKRLQSTKERQLPYQEFCALVKARSEWEKHISKLWNNWFCLQESTRETDPAVWAMFFQLLEEDLNKYFCNGDSEDIDEQVNLSQNQNELADALAFSHLKEMEDPIGPRMYSGEHQE